MLTHFMSFHENLIHLLCLIIFAIHVVKFADSVGHGLGLIRL